ncbi:MAG TPA: 2Fe-2S iron-sulfur cluster-binding protein, partial [Polyangiales bacterium]
MLHIRLEPLGIELTSASDSRLIDLLDDVDDTKLVAGVPLSCRGARCGVCRVRVVRGESAIIAPRADERDTLRILGADPDERLACQLELRAD